MSKATTWKIEIQDLNVRIGANTILEKITATIEAGCITAVIGPNGSGKSTLLRAILGLMKYEGEILFTPKNEEDVPAAVTPATSKIRPKIGYVPQHFNFDRGIPATVSDFLIIDLQTLPLWLGEKRRWMSRVCEELKRVGAETLLNKRLGVLSGGELQRVMLAKALLRQPQILLLDEPVSGVDIAGEELFCDLLEHLQRSQQLTLVMVSHDLSVVSRHAERVLCINRNLICQGTVQEVVTRENIQAIYGVHMGFHQHGHSHAGHKHD